MLKNLNNSVLKLYKSFMTSSHRSNERCNVVHLQCMLKKTRQTLMHELNIFVNWLSFIIISGAVNFTCALCGKHHELFSIPFSDFQRDLFHILCLLKDLLVDPKCSADGRDNAIGLIAKNVPRTDIREGTNQRVMAFLGIDGKFGFTLHVTLRFPVMQT